MFPMFLGHLSMWLRQLVIRFLGGKIPGAKDALPKFCVFQGISSSDLVFWIKCPLVAGIW